MNKFMHIARVFLSAFVLMQLFISSASAQVYGNEWIVPGQTYFKIPVGQTGMYAVSYEQLDAAQVPFVSPAIDPKYIQLWHRGVEQRIIIKGELDGGFNPGDSLFFYGERNDGTLDSLLYEPNSYQPHKYYNLYSDTSAYFLTWSSTTLGKRIPSITTNPVSPDAYHLAEILNLYTSDYNQGFRHSVETYYTTGDKGEGWFGGWLHYPGGPSPVNANYVLNAPNLYASGPPANLEIMFVGANGSQMINNHFIDIFIGNSPTPIPVQPFAFHDVKVFTCQVPLSDFSASGDLTVTISNKGNGTIPSAIYTAYIKLTYPQTFNMGGAGEKYFNLLPNTNPVNIEISNSSAGAAIYNISDKNNIVEITSSVQAGLLKATLASSGKLFVVSPANYLPIPSVKSVDLEPFTNSLTADYIIVTNNKIITGAREYADYRASAEGGNYDVLLADVDKLYNMYSYGERTPVAIRRFITHLVNTGDSAKYLFIIGKGLSTSFYSNGLYYRKDPMFHINHPDINNRREDLVPTYGMPGSDLLYSMGLKGNSAHVAALATGRLSAKTVDEVRGYLFKIKEHESLPNALWRKNLIHLSGGFTDDEKINFSNHMNSLKYIAEDVVFGGKVVKSFLKKGQNAVDKDEVFISSVASEINKGVSYVTFFGHSSPGVIDLDIGTASNQFYGYNNHGKYPMLFINGCAAAHVFDRYSFIEDWILTPDRGAILSLGHSDAGYAQQLSQYSRLFYINAFQKPANAGKSVGDIQISTIKDFYNIFGMDVKNITTLQQMIIEGDPALALYSPAKPDYETSDAKLFIKSYNNKLVTAVSDSFAIGIIVSNLGVDFGDSLSVTVRRIINGKVTLLGPVVYKPIKYQDTLYFTIRSKDIATYGENIFEVALDPYDSIPELKEDNNNATLRYFMPLSGVVALFPKEYSIVNSNSGTVTLIAQSTNLLVGNTSYYFEIDTSYLFNSPLKKSNVINAGSLVKWRDLVLPLSQDSLVYYWRVRYNNIAFGADTLWGESSFIYIAGSPEGWSQSEFPQFLKDGINKVERNISQRNWSFSNSYSRILVKAVGNTYISPNPPASQPFHETIIQVNGTMYEYLGMCAGNSLLAVAFDQNTALPYTPYPYEGANCGMFGSGNRLNAFSQLSDGTSSPNGHNQSDLIEYINRVPDGDYILFVSSSNAHFDSWTTTLKDKFKNELGANLIDNLQNGMPYMLLARKNHPDGPVFEKYDSLTNRLISHEDTLAGTFNKGHITSTLIGPASEWTTLFRTFYASETPVTDQYEVKIIGVNIEGFNTDTISIPFQDSLDLNTVSQLNQYPFIRLLAEVTDIVNLTPPQLKKWQVIYTGVPEGTMNPALVGLSQYNAVAKQEGDSISLCFAFENISTHDFPDTLQVRYTITNSTKGATTTMVTLKKLKVDSVIIFCHKFSTRGLEGNNVLQAYVNPRIQKEEYYHNNVLEMSFTVEKDKIHPILDVVFDGVHIMDGDIVSPSPMITVTVNDENKFLMINSADDMEIFLKKPLDPSPVKVDFTSSDILSAKQVGKNGKNIFQVEYNPQKLPDGIYTLIVRGKDASENSSGALDYRISFEVINASSITHFYPYPNPFSTSTRFVFTLTGSEIPEDLKIQIMTVTGKVVREITKAELGPIRIGNNKSEYAWDGTDEFGDKLANGVYLYRVILKNGGDIKHRETAGDKAFKKNFGKLYILR